MTPRAGEPADEPQRTSIDAMAEATHIAKQIAGGNEDDLRMVAEAIGPFIYAVLNARIQGDVRDDRKIRVTSDGADVKNTSAGTQVKFPGESYYDHLNFAGMTLDVESSIAGRRVNIQGSGGGTDCMWDFIVSACFSTLAGFTEGMTRYSLSGCPFLCYSTFQGVSTYLDASSTNGGEYSVLLCGITTESVTVTPGATSKYDGLFVYGGGRGVSGITGTLTIAGSPASGTKLDFYDCYLPTVTTSSGGNAPGHFVRCQIDNFTSTGSGKWVGATVDDCKITVTVSSASSGAWEACKFTHCVIDGSIDLSAGLHQGIIVTDNILTSGTSQIKVTGRHCQIHDNHWNVSGDHTVNSIVISGGATPAGGNSIHDNHFAPPVSPVTAVIDITHTGYSETSITGNTIAYTSGNTTVNFVQSAATSEACVTVTGNTLEARNDTPTYLETDGGISISGKFINSTFGPNTPSDFDLELLTGSANNLYIGLGTVSGAGAAGVTIIPGGLAPFSEPFVTIGNTAGLSAERALTAGTGIDLTDGGANGNATLDLANLTQNWTQAGVFDISHAGNLLVLKHIGLGSTGGVSAPANTLLLSSEAVTDWVSHKYNADSLIAANIGANNALNLTMDRQQVAILGSGAGTWAHSGIIYGFHNKLTMTKNTATAISAADLRQVFLEAALNTGTTLTDRYGIRINDATGVGTLTNQYGLYIENMAKGGTLNRAIQSLGGISTHLGAFRIGSNTAPTNVTDGDITGTRLIVPDAAILHSAITQLGGPVVIPGDGALLFSDNTNYIGLRAPATSPGTNFIYELPDDTPSAGQVLAIKSVAGSPVITTEWVAAGAGGGDVATDAIWDAAGDLAVGTGANTAAVLSKPSPTEVANTTPSAFTNWASQAGNARKTLMFDSATGAIEWDYLTAIDVLTPAQVLTFTCTPAGGTSSVGLVASSGTDVPAFVMTYQGTPTNADIDIQSETYAGSPEVNVGDYTVDAPLFTSLTGPAINRGTAVGESVTFRLTATVDGQSKTKDVTVTYYNLRLWGISTVAAIDTDGEIDTFYGAQSSEVSSSRVKTFTVTAGAGEYIYYMIRSALGTPTFTVGGFEGGFTLVGNDISFSNTRGFTENYDIWRSDLANLGATTVVVT